MTSVDVRSIMAGPQDDDIYLFQSSLDQTPSAFAGQDFDSFLAASPENDGDDTLTGGFLNPSDLTIKRERTDRTSNMNRLPRSSRSSASSSSSSTSARYLKRNISTATSTASPVKLHSSQSWGSGINGLSMPSTEQYYNDTSMSGLDQDFEASNQQMASAFDFDTAASTPSGFDPASVATMKPNVAVQPFRRSATMTNFSNVKNTSPRVAGGQPHFFLGSREASPFNTMLPSTTTASPWTKHSPSSGLEETFNHITMNGDSPGRANLSPNMQFNAGGFTFDADFGGTPTSFNKDMTSPPSTIHSGDGNPYLTIYPTSLKSRVETQIPIKMVLFPLPQGAKKLRLPTHTVSKPKFLAKPEVEKSPEVLELFTSLVCSSAMQDSFRREKALARARGDDLSSYTRPSPASSSGSHNSSKDDDEKPLNGGEVKICSGCIQRERKRASRKKQKKPEEEEMFQKDEEKRVVVFNTSEIKDWVEVTKDNQSSVEVTPPPPAGAMQVELPMRIACYCRHQNEKLGFQVIFTIKDYRDKVIAQAMTNSIMITDDHKTHNAPAPVQSNSMSQMPAAPQLPGAGVFSTSGMEMPNASQSGGKLFKQSFSTTDLHGLQHNFNPNFPMAPSANPFAVPANMSAMASGTMTPRILSRPASPSGPSGPTTKRRKQSGSGKVPSGLTMTRLDTSHTASNGAATMPNTAASSPFAVNMPSFMSPGERQYQMPNRPQQPFSTSPPTPNGNDGNFPTGINKSFSLENIPRQAMISAPPSRQPSRANSPHLASNRNSFGASDHNFGQAVTNGLVAHPSRRPAPIIHKLVPAEGSVTGGTEVTLLGNGFYQGLEVMFGDTEATTTTFWGEKCLNCIAPPALQAGVVAVMFKHEHPQYSTMQQQSQHRPSVFTYVDDREIEILRLALKTLGRQMQHPTDDPFSAAQQLLQQNQSHGIWPQQGGYSMTGGGHQRQMPAFAQMEMMRLESNLIDMLRFVKERPGSKPVQLDLRRPNGASLLHLASSLGMGRFVVALLLAGADPNLVDKSGHTAMHHAAMHGYDKIIDRLRSAGADHRTQSLQGFVAADLATTLAAHQATVRPYQHSQSHSMVMNSILNHQSGNVSALSRSFRDRGSTYDGDNDSDSSDNSSSYSVRMPLPYAQPDPRTTVSSRAVSRRGSTHFKLVPSASISRRNSIPDKEIEIPSENALMQAWHQILNITQMQQQQLAAQIQQFQENAHRALPQLPTIAQDHPFVRRMSSLFPLRGDEDEATDVERRDTIRPLASSSSHAPPAYNELFPDSGNSDEDFALKKFSAVQAAADAAADIQLESYETGSIPEPKMEKRVQPQATLEGDGPQSRAQRIGLVKDKKTFFFFWIPLLCIVLALMLNIPDLMHVVSPGFGRIRSIFDRQVVEAV